MKHHRRFVLYADHVPYLPLALESVGINPEQEQVIRPEGYPHYHWLQTVAGEGIVHVEGKSFVLRAGAGIILFPGVPHTYENRHAELPWESAYLTFDGPIADTFLTQLGIHRTTFFRYPPESAVDRIVVGIVEQFERGVDVFGIDPSAETYRFLLTLARHGVREGKNSRNMERFKKLRGVIDWMETRIADPDIGMEEIANVLGLSDRRMNDLFREAFGQSPYAYLIRLRIRKAKEQLVRSTLTVREVASQVGFRDASHFVATFRKHVGMTPEQFRNYH